VFRSL